jgi:hypothetical protein
MTGLVNINTLWFEVALIGSLTAVGHIFFAHFETHTPKWKKVLKLIFFITLACTVSATLGRAWFFVLFALLLLAVVVIHVWWLPSKGINGWTAEPKEKYYALRGWQVKDNDTFNKGL